MAATGSTCGALNGAILALSMMQGRESMDDNRERLYANTQELVNGFKEKFEHTRCPELIHIQLGTPEASAEYQERGLSSQCEQYIRFTTQMAVILLAEEE